MIGDHHGRTAGEQLCGSEPWTRSSARTLTLLEFRKAAIINYGAPASDLTGAGLFCPLSTSMLARCRTPFKGEAPLSMVLTNRDLLRTPRIAGWRVRSHQQQVPERGLWGTRTRPPVLTRHSTGSLVFVDEAAENGLAPDPLPGQVRDGVVGRGGRSARLSRPELVTMQAACGLPRCGLFGVNYPDQEESSRSASGATRRV
jgi:hypothetical protein